MKKHWTMLAKGLTLTLVIIAVFSLSGGVARADDVTITGFSTGTITNAPQLTFTGNPNFTGSTVGGAGSLSGANSLGTFSLSTGPTQFITFGTVFLNVSFTSPTGITGGPSVTFTGVIKGSISPNIDQGGVNIGFSTFPQFFTFNDGIHNGSFSLVLPPLFIQSGQSASLTAGIAGQQSTIPEPATLILLGTGLTGIAARLRKRRKLRA